ncbi:hypothetical protein HNY73_015916 [Argiope bruennichi]|uniref:Uncharacterized protein n=1 Tax=Argiope bruennichi TaxID=94029 RepID=A0A8T0EI92_ARGBR|nr:hypothetical protein HNY73_015916 [Argiope bruennichi]
MDAGSLQMQLLDLKTKDLWNGKFAELKSKLQELEVQKCMHIVQHKWAALKEIPPSYSTHGIVFQNAIVR